jgi:hypothetical protein
MTLIGDTPACAQCPPIAAFGAAAGDSASLKHGADVLVANRGTWPAQ